LTWIDTVRSAEGVKASLLAQFDAADAAADELREHAGAQDMPKYVYEAKTCYETLLRTLNDDSYKPLVDALDKNVKPEVLEMVAVLNQMDAEQHAQEEREKGAAIQSQFKAIHAALQDMRRHPKEKAFVTAAIAEYAILIPMLREEDVPEAVRIVEALEKRERSLDPDGSEQKPTFFKRAMEHFRS